MYTVIVEGGFRRAVELGICVSALLTSCSSDDATTPAQVPDPQDLEALAADAFVWGYPLAVTERTFKTLGALVGTNALFNQAAVTTSSARIIVAPNQDTLYSVAVVDLRSEPFVLDVPDVFDRYWTYQFLDAWTESFHYIGTRATGGRGGRFVITPPGWTGTLPSGTEPIGSPTPRLFLLGRFHVRSVADAANVVALSRSLVPLHELTGDPAPQPPEPVGASPGPPQNVGADGAGFFDELGDALALDPPASDFDRLELERFRALGLAAGAHPTETADAERLAFLDSGARRGLERIVSSGSSRDDVNGWRTAGVVGRYGEDALLRALVARFGWGANVPEEALYPSSLEDSAGATYDGSNRYVLHFAAGQTPPIEGSLGFWSVTAYGTDMFFVKNDLERYSIGSNSPGLAFNADGSLDLLLQAEPPPEQSNWLPIPAAAPFVLMMRVYLPTQAMGNGDYVVPGVERLP